MKTLLAPAALVTAALATLAAPVAAPAAAPAAYPTRTITIVVPTAAGGGTEAMARTIAQKL